MSDLTAERLWEIMEPVWTKHPGTRPAGMWRDDCGNKSWRLYGYGHAIVPLHATLLCEAQMTRWLAGAISERDDLKIGAPNSDDVEWRLSFFGVDNQWAPTLIEALAATIRSLPDA